MDELTDGWVDWWMIWLMYDLTDGESWRMGELLDGDELTDGRVDDQQHQSRGITSESHGMALVLRHIHMTRHSHDCTFTCLGIHMAPTWHDTHMTWHLHHVALTWHGIHMTSHSHHTALTWHGTHVTWHSSDTALIRHGTHPTRHSRDMALIRDGLHLTWHSHGTHMTWQIVVRTSENGGLKYHKYHVIGKEVEECTNWSLSKKLVATTVSSRDVVISRRKEGTTMSSRGEEMVHENQNHEDFEVKGGGRQRLRHVDCEFPSCMRKAKKEQHPEDDPSEYGWMEEAEAEKNHDSSMVTSLRCMRNK